MITQLKEEYLRQVKAIAKKLKRKLPKVVEFDELVADGYLGLVKAMRTYSPEYGCKECTYFEFVIRGAMLDGLRERNKTRSLYKIDFYSLDIPNEEGHRVLDSLNAGGAEHPDTALINKEFQVIVSDMLDRLNPKLKTVLLLYYWDEMLMIDIGKILGVNQSRVSQMHGEALRRLRGVAACTGARESIHCN